MLTLLIARESFLIQKKYMQKFCFLIDDADQLCACVSGEASPASVGVDDGHCKVAQGFDLILPCIAWCLIS